MPSITQSIEKLQKKLEKDPNSLLFSQLAEEHRKEGNFEDAIRILKTGLARHPNYWTAHVTLGRVYHQMGNTPSAREELEKVVQAVPDNLLANRLLGDIYNSIQLPGEALKRLRIIQMLTPGNPELVATIHRLESEVVEEAPAPPSAVPVEPAAEAEPPVEQEPVTVDAESAEEVYAPTMQVQIPDFLDKTEVPVASDSYELPEPSAEDAAFADSLVEPAEMMALPEEILIESEPFESEPETEAEQTPEVDGFTPDTLILEPGVLESSASEDNGHSPPVFQSEAESYEEVEAAKDDFEEPKDSDELSTLASLLMSTEPSSMDREFEELEEDEVESYQRDVRPQDRTQPLQETGVEEDIGEADELTSETLAELYLNQGLIDKAVKVYERLLLNDPENPRILQRLKELSPDAITPEENEPVEREHELLLVEQSRSARAEISARQRKINTLEHWLTTIRRERD